MPDAAPKSLFRNVLIALAAAVGVLVAVFAWVWSGPAVPVLERAPVKAFEVDRETDGSWPELPIEQPPVSVSFSVVERSANTTANMQKLVSGPKGGRLDVSSVEVVTTTDAPLEQAVALRIIAALQLDDGVRSIRFVSSADELIEGRSRPSMVVEVELLEVADETTLGAGVVRAEVAVRAATDVRKGTIWSAAERPTPALVTVDWNSTVATEFDQRGFATPNNTFDATATLLADKAVDGMTEMLAEARRECGAYPALPAAYEVDYRAVDASLDVSGLGPDGVVWERLHAWRAPLAHNESLWVARFPATREAALQRAAAGLQEMGYEADPARRRGRILHRKGDVEVSVYAFRARDVASPRPVVTPSPDAGKEVVVYVEYRHSADAARVTSAHRAALEAEPTMQDLLCLLPDLRGDERGQALAMLDAELWDPGQLIDRARVRHQVGDGDGAARDLALAQLLEPVALESKGLVDRLEEAAEDMGVELGARRVEAARLRSLGLPELEVGGESVRGTTRIGAPIACFAMSARSDGVTVPVLIMAGCGRNDDGEAVTAVKCDVGDGVTFQAGNGVGPHAFGRGVVGGQLYYEFSERPSLDGEGVGVRVWAAAK